MKTSVNRDPEPCDKDVQQKYDFRSRQSLEPLLPWMAFFEESSTTKNFGGNCPYFAIVILKLTLTQPKYTSKFLWHLVLKAYQTLK